MVEFLFALIPSLFVAKRYGFLIGFMRLLVLGLLIGALLNPKIELEGEVILLRDVSGSMPEEFSHITYPGAREVRFGSQDETNLEAALREVSSDSVVLLSDGFETSGSALSQNYPFKIYPIIPDNIIKSQAGISQIRYPARIKKGTQGEVEIVASGKGETLKIIHDGKSILEEKVTEEKVFKFLTPLMQDKVQDYEAVIFDGDKRVSERKFGIIPFESRKTFVLGKETRLLKLLPQSENFEFVENLDRIDEAGTLILANIPFKDISRYQEKLKTRVNEGLHLVFTGGNKSFGLGEYINTGLEPLFPVKLKPPEKEEKRLNVAVQLVLDKSQSMRDQGRLNSAKDAASQVILTLKDDDFIGVIGFDQEPFEVIPISS